MLKEQLLKVQCALKAPKSQFNEFGNYPYRNCEDILEAVKPLLLEHKLTLTVNDEIISVGDRYYVKATAYISDEKEVLSVSAYARESLEKKGMDVAQITGSTSSYARKYALNGLFLIDDTKDPDHRDNTKEGKNNTVVDKKTATQSEPQQEAIDLDCKLVSVKWNDVKKRSEYVIEAEPFHEHITVYIKQNPIKFEPMQLASLKGFTESLFKEKAYYFCKEIKLTIPF